ncbi:MAG: 16S rRNA (guanine(527)-N(7))-methyltransferase RsmG, partial [Bacteroidales bacterium]|nr:16S rRNA (guanine(527)-N(7))-methyltransferase RsmG [Bacteroidales bacterium]
MDIIRKYFPALTPRQTEQFAALQDLYRNWNAKINVISRKDIDSLYERHILHSLGIAKVIRFLPEATVLDVGTGGGFPGIPLAVIFPDTAFTLVDSIAKKIRVVNEVASAIDLKNITAMVARAETVKNRFDFVVSRAVTALPNFVPLVAGKIARKNRHELPDGILYLKGGDFNDELATFANCRLFNLSDWFAEEFFETKKV